MAPCPDPPLPRQAPGLPRSIERHGRGAAVVFFAALLAVGLGVSDDFGLGWDEHRHRLTGIRFFDYVTAGSGGFRTDYHRHFGVAFELPLVLLERALGLEDPRSVFLMRHTVTFLFCYLGVVFFYLLCKRRFGSRWVALLGALMLVLSPRIFVDSFYNTYDLVLMAGFTISTWTLLRFLDGPSPARAALHALTSAFLVSVRVVGVFMPMLTLGLGVVGLVVRRGRVPRARMAWGLAVYVPALVIAVVASWPFLWEAPLARLLETFGAMSRNVAIGELDVLYLGKLTRAADLPWHYAPVWILISTPEVHLLFLPVGLVASAVALLRPRGSLCDGRRDTLVFVAWLLGPLAAVVGMRSIVYDSWRHLFFVFPALVLVSLTGLVAAARWTAGIHRRAWRRAATVAIAAVTALGLVDVASFMVTAHPHQNVYFNRFAGLDPLEVERRFDLDYWGLSYRRALEHILLRDVRPEVKVLAANDPGVHNAALLEPEARKRLVFVGGRDQADYFVTNFRWNPAGHPELGPEFFSIVVDGLRIMAVYKLR